MLRFFGYVFVLLSLPLSSAWGWGCLGHQAVAMLAYGQLHPNALRQVKAALADLSAYSDLHHYCNDSGLPPFGAVATWADDIRDVRPETAPWHFIDIPLSALAADYPSFCDRGTGCVVTAIQHAVATLRNTGSAPKERTEQLIFLIHFVGDIHQPLHDETNNDRGGNCLPLTYFSQHPVEGKNESFKPNLHGIWDTELVQALIHSRGGPTAFVQYLQEQYRNEMSVGTAPNYMRWVAEAHAAAGSIAYARLPVRVPIEQPVPIEQCSDDNHVSQRLAALGEQVGPKYSAQVSPTIELQLARAGFRLAALLNHIWP